VSMSRAFNTGSLPRAYDVDGTGTSVELGRTNAVLSSGWAQTQIDFRSDDTNTDYSLRLARGNTGANAASFLQHNGTGQIQFYSSESAAISFFVNNTNVGAIAAGGQFFTLNQPFFAASWANVGTLATTNDIIWSSVTYNIGSHYNSSTGVFTAPVAGDYLFYFRVLFVNATAGRTDLVFHRNGAQVPGGRFVLQKPANVWYSLHGTMILAIAANDTMSVRPSVLGPGIHNDVNFNSFGGYFLG
jgi:hypothetical protein